MSNQEMYGPAPEGHDPNKVQLVSNTASSAGQGFALAGPAGALISGASSLLGGLFSNKKNREAEDRAWERQKESLQNSVQWRVADAKKAGIHPLYAMGQAPMSISPMAFQDQVGPALSEMGQSVGNVIARTTTQNEKLKEYYDLQLAGAMLEKESALADYYRSEADKNKAASLSGISAPGLGLQHESGQYPNTPGVGYMEVKPAEQLSSKMGHEYASAGVNPAYQLRYMDKGLPMYLPIAEGDSPEETISEMSFPTWAGLLLRNARIFGPGWLRDMVNSRYFGKEPAGVYDPRAKRTTTKKGG